MIHVLPPSSDDIISPHHFRGLGPTLKKSNNGPCLGWNKTGFQQGYCRSVFSPPFATSSGLLHLPSIKRDTQMPTSLEPSSLPPNHDATSPVDVSSIVDEWHIRVGRSLIGKMNSDLMYPFCPGDAREGNWTGFIVKSVAQPSPRNIIIIETSCFISSKKWKSSDSLLLIPRSSGRGRGRLFPLPIGGVPEIKMRGSDCFSVFAF